LENRRSEDVKMFGRMWKVVETKAGKTGVAKAERRREKVKEEKKKKKSKETKTMDVKKVVEE